MTVPRVPVAIRASLIGCVGAFFFVAGVTFIFLWGTLVVSVIKSQLKVVPGSETFRLWKDTPIPQYMNFYFFNWTNHEELGNGTPTFEEVGPYRFSIEERKTDIIHNGNGTISFRIKRFWYFDRSNSIGPLDHEIVTLNTVAKTAAHSINGWSNFMRRSLSISMGALGTEIHVKKKVGELLFDGYSDPLLETASKLPAFAGLNVPFDKFGWFYKRNGSTEFDGLFNMDTGENGVEEVGVLRRWNLENSTGFYEGSCGMVNGSAGELFPPGVDKERGIEMFSPDLCRSLKLKFAEEVQEYGITGYKFTGDEYTFDNGTLDPSNECFCGGECAPSGVLNVTACRFGAPGFVSFPHFLLADSFYSEQVNGMSADPQRHSLYITLEPTYGIPIDVAARFQINILMTPDDIVSIFQDVPKTYFPMIWFEQRASITPELASQLRMALAAPDWDLYASCGFLAVGAVLVAWSAYICLVQRPRNEKSLVEEREDIKIVPLQNGRQEQKEVESLLKNESETGGAKK